MKPRLRRWYGRWECFGGSYSCLADTPMKAWQNWCEAEGLDSHSLLVASIRERRLAAKPVARLYW